LLLKGVPWSLIKILGHPNLVITCSNKKFVAVFVLESLTSVASSHIVKHYVKVMMYLAPHLFNGGWIGPTKSISHFSDICKVTCGFRGISSLLLGLETL
jgi:hypothetical protein